jgi:tetratricopeptide (TPR) repeat protein
MSSIYDALRRNQAERHTAVPMETAGKSPTRKIFWAIIVAVLISSACTALLLYGIGVIGDEDVDQGIQVKSDQPDLDRIWDLTKKADRLYKKGDLQEAIEAYSEILTLSPASADLYLKLGGLYYETKQFDKALSLYMKARKLSRNDAKLLNNIGSVLLAKGDAPKALGYFIQAHRYSADYVEPMYNMACAYARMKNKDAALSSLSQACSMQPEARLWARRDPDLQSLKGDKDFETIVRTQ